MSEIYEGIVFRSADVTAISAFREISAPFPLRLVRLADGVFGVYFVASRSSGFNVEVTTSLATTLSKSVSAALAVFYDSRSGFRSAAAFLGGRLSTEYSEKDEWWVPLSDSGELRRDAPQLTAPDLNPHEEYGCVRDAIEVGLIDLGVPPAVTRDTLKDAFCYERSVALAEKD